MFGPGSQRDRADSSRLMEGRGRHCKRRLITLSNPQVRAYNMERGGRP